MPLLFSIGIQGALEKVADALTPDEQIYAFLDDVYIVCQPDRVRFLFDLLAESINVATQVLRWHTLPQPGNTRFSTCSASSCWSACASLCPSRRQSAVARSP